MAAFLRIMVSRIREEVKPRPQARRQNSRRIIIIIITDKGSGRKQEHEKENTQGMKNFNFSLISKIERQHIKDQS